MMLIDVTDAIKKLRNAGVKMHTINGVKAVDLDVVISFLQNQPVVRAVPIDGNFGVMQTCAIRYACGRRTYMPSLVIDYITPLIPHLPYSGWRRAYNAFRADRRLSCWRSYYPRHIFCRRYYQTVSATNACLLQ